MDDSSRDLKVVRQRLISCHEEFRRSLDRMHYMPSFRFTPSAIYDRKPSGPPVPLDGLSPIHCTSLMLNTVHYGRVLRGILIVDPTVMNAAHSILEDEAGGCTKVSFYNFAPEYLRFFQCTSIADSLFRSGKKIAIAEPFYKIAQDGTPVVRVESSVNDLSFPHQLGPRNSQGWRADGKTHFTSQEFAEAIFCYRCSIGLHTESKLAAVLLSNISSCLLKKGLYVASLLSAVASFVVDSSIFRPFYSAGFCLSRLNRKDLAHNCLEQCKKLKAPSLLCRQLTELFGDTPTERMPACEWNAKVMSLVAPENIFNLLRISSCNSVDIKTLKQKGNELFREEHYDEAIQNYCTALRGISEVALLLTNRSICYAKIGNHAEAALHASAAILISPSNEKAHYWKCLSLLELGNKKEARTSCHVALEIIGGSASLKALRERIK